MEGFIESVWGLLRSGDWLFRGCEYRDNVHILPRHRARCPCSQLIASQQNRTMPVCNTCSLMQTDKCSDVLLFPGCFVVKAYIDVWSIICFLVTRLTQLCVLRTRRYRLCNWTIYLFCYYDSLPFKNSLSESGGGDFYNSSSY